MARFAKILSFCFKWLNFFLDLFQTVQFFGGGGIGALITGIIAWSQGLSLLLSALLALIAGVAVVIILALIFKEFAKDTIESKRLTQLPPIVYSIHNRITKVREKYEREIDWSKIDKNKVIQPIVDATMENFEGGLSENSSTDDKVVAVTESLEKLGEHKMLSVFDITMDESETSLTRRLKRDFLYNCRLAQLEQYKPYPNRSIALQVQKILDASMTYNNDALFQHYYNYEYLNVDLHTAIKGMHNTIQSAVDIACADLKSLVSQYMAQNKVKKQDAHK